MVRTSTKAIKLSKEALTDVEWMSKYEKYYSFITFKKRILEVAGYKHLRQEMAKASEQDWEKIYKTLYIKEV